MNNGIYKVLTVKYIDGEFFEEGDSRRYHNKANELFTRQLCGIGEDTHWDYLHKRPEELEGYELSEYIKLILWLLVKLFKLMTTVEAEKFLWKLRREIERAERVAARNGLKLNNADRLFNYLFVELRK